MNIAKIRVTGVNPLLMHNIRLANPLELIVQEIKTLSSKRKRTLEDHTALARLEFEGGLYIDKQGPYIPGVAFHAALVSAGKVDRLGSKIKNSIVCSTLRAPLIYDGPRDVEGLWKAGFYDQRMVAVERARTLRTRPMFENWSAEFEIVYAPSDFDDRTIKEIVTRSGRVGLLDYRPVYGTFTAKIKSISAYEAAA